jgi:hypothetical protein
VNFIGRYDFFADVIYIAENFAKADPCPPRAEGAEKIDFGIDCLAVALRHEGQHRFDFVTWWGRGLAGYNCADDWDGDLVPNEIEKRQGCDPWKRQSCPNLPTWLDPGMSDREADGYWAGWQWKPGDAKDEDWAVPGSQWPEGN